MAMEQGSFTRGSTGTAIISMEGTFTPSYFEFSIGPRTSTNETHVIYSSGSQDINLDRKQSVSIFDDGTVSGTRETTSYAITHYKNVSGTLTKIISGYVSAVDAGEFTVNFDTVDSAYTIRFRAFE
jgi:hypothetical protein